MVSAMDANLCLSLIVEPALSWLEYDFRIKRTPSAERFMLAIAGQESGFTARRQMGDGPARGWWQFERGGGVVGVLTHPASAGVAKRVCEALAVPPGPAVVHPALEQCDLLAAAFARLLILTDPAPLPETEASGWAYYLRVWRPGKPHPETWPKRWAEAEAAIRG